MKNAKSPGRPRAFDPERALEAAMELFWRKGYEGTSLSDLTEAMGINRPSLYAAFGNKEELFGKVVARYVEGALAEQKICAYPTAREAVEALLCGTAGSACNAERAGCLLVVGGLAGGEESEGARQTMCAVRTATVEMWRERFARAQREGELPPDTDPLALARYVMTVVHGMTVQARSGATSEDLRRVAELAMRAWPAPPVRAE